MSTFTFESPYLEEVQRAIAKYPEGRQQSALLCALDQAQRQNHTQGHYVTPEAMDTIARMLKMPSMRVLEVASFYTMINLKPVGRFHIQLCGTTPCLLRGADSLMEAAQGHLGITAGETTSDGMFTLTEVECLGACCNAPMVQINDDYYEDLTPDLLTSLLDRLGQGLKTTPGSQTGRVSSEPQGE